MTTEATTPPETTSLSRSWAAGAFGAAFSAAAGFALTWILSRGFGPEGAGLVLQVIAAATICVSFTKVGMDSAALWLVPRLLVSEPTGARGVVTFAAAIAVGGGAAAAVVFAVAATLIAPGQPSLARALTIAAPWLPLAGALAVSTSALRALGATRSYVVWSNVAQPAVRLIAVAAIIATGGGSDAAAIAWSAVPSLILVPVLLETHRTLRRAEAGSGPTAWVAPPARRSVLLRFALPRTLSAGLEQGLLWLDLLIVGVIAGTGAAGIYGGASRFVAAGLVVDAALRMVVAPRISALLHRGEREATEALYRSTTSSLILFGAPVYVVLAAFAPAALGLLGPDFVAGSAALIVLCAGAAIAFCAGPVHSVLIMSGHSGRAAANKGIVLAANVALDILLVPSFGILGAAIAWSLCMVLDCVLAAYQVHVRLSIRLDAASVLRPLATVALCAGAPVVIALAIAGPDSLGAAIGAGAAAAFCVAGVHVARSRRLNTMRRKTP